ncbi:hypothetical protein FRX31_011154, partial [Thalictrum thalictroides]
DVIEQVTTDLEASEPPPTVICVGFIKQNCFDKCRATPIKCAQLCDCITVSPGFDRN